MKATRKYEYKELTDPGNFIWQDNILYFKCPCGCGIVAGTSVKPHNEHGWDWNGDLDEPTVRPSIFINPEENHWHGYLTNGEFKQC